MLADVECDLLCVDAPYSARTHRGHDEILDVGGKRRAIGYDGWESSDVRECVKFFAPRTSGWMVSITDHVLAPVWADAFESAGRYAFAPLPWVAHGSRVRLQGDGPSSWTCWVMVARPRGRKFTTWGTLPGAYVVNAWNHGTLAHGAQQQRLVGGKPIALMQAIVSDYSRPGDVVCDPCAGGGTTLLAARKLGRHAIGAEMDPETHRKASSRLGLVDTSGDLPLFGGGA